MVVLSEIFWNGAGIVTSPYSKELVLRRRLLHQAMTAKALESEGHSYDTMAYTDGFNMRPRRFECDIKVRSEKHREVLLAEEQEAWDVLKRFPAFD
ncbi:hypothetical protein IWX90DRAFT_481945 [Phyllosticta citrichinensis]|uniref:Uncharacterized protein n=1 Tax=Phyllosticta citrichinensis TaxID=1130410 RepID=A0ABR1Y4V2_9PEZI